MRRGTFIKCIGVALAVLWAIAVPTESSQTLQEFSTPRFWSITMGTDKPFEPVTITIVQLKDKTYMAYGRTSKFFFEVRCTDAPSPIDPTKAKSSLLIAGSADVLFREGSRLISDKEIGLVLGVLKVPAGAFSAFSQIPKPSGFCQLYLDRRSGS